MSQTQDTYSLYKSLAKKAGVGILVLIATPILALFALISVILIPTSLIALVLYFILIYLSSLLVSYVVGSKLQKKFTDKELFK